MVAGYHYVETARDFSDLPEKLEWCRTHDEECKQIALNGRTFILENFCDPHREEEIEKAIVKMVSVKT